MHTAQRPITLLVCALGGEGGGVLTEWLVETARVAGYPAQSTSIPGVAQRTGATTYYLEVFPQTLAALGGRRPVFGLNPVPGALDALVSSELLETARQVGNGMASPDRTHVITSSSRSLTTQERMQLADGRRDPAALRQLVATFSRRHQIFDMAALARECGTVVSAVMLGAIAGSGLLPFAREHYEAVVRAGGKGAEASLRGFARAYALVQEADTQAGFVEQLLSKEEHLARTGSGPEADFLQGFPAPVHDMLALGHARVLEYQDAAYAQRYLDRVRRVLEAERASDPAGTHGLATTREMARWLALWMAFDDIVRVAGLKARAARWQRVRGEVKAGEADLLRVWDHFKPGVPEFAALMPAGIAQRALAWDARRVARGRQPWALPLKVGTHTATGMLALRALGGLKWLRVRGHRFATEQAMIDRWLDGVVQGTGRQWALGHAIAQCGRLIKGYGSTNERGKENLLHVLDHLAPGPDAAAAAVAVDAAREAALADDAGRALDATLLAHGAPARPVKAQPIRWTHPPKGLAGGKA
jgi:indolepyruvate ferredoxin oxidoreductase beta subunit